MNTFTHGAWCELCERNGPVHTHKCKTCDHVERDWMSIHRDGYCFGCHPMNAEIAAAAKEFGKKYRAQLAQLAEGPNKT